MNDLTRIEGIGKATAKKLAEAGIDSFEKLATIGAAGQRAEQLGVKVEWIAEAARMLPAVTDQNTQGKPLRPDDGPEALLQDRAGLPADGGLGDPHIHTPESEDRGGGGGNPVVPAREQSNPADFYNPEACPLLAAAVTDWIARGISRAPLIRISARRDGFRRAGMAHPKAPVDHPIDRFTPEQIEELLGEPNLMVAFE